MTHGIVIAITALVGEENRNVRLLHDFETALGSHRRLRLDREEGQDDIDDETGECYTRCYQLTPLP